MASPDDTTQQAKAQPTSDHPPTAEETSSSATPHYQHPIPFTIVPNCFIDDYVPRLSPTAQSVMLVLYRLTLGWHRAETFTSQKDLRQHTGIASYATLNAARKRTACGWIDHGEPPARTARTAGLLFDACGAQCSRICSATRCARPT